MKVATHLFTKTQVRSVSLNSFFPPSTIRKTWALYRGSETTLTGSTDECKVRASGQGFKHQATPLCRRSEHTSSAGLAGLQLRDALYTEHTAQVRVKGVESSELRSQLMNAGLSITSCGCVTERHSKEQVDKKYDAHCRQQFGCEAELQEVTGNILPHRLSSSY